MNLQKILQKIGLTEKEARIYLASLQLGKSTVISIAKKSEIKRPTAYVLLGGLVEKGIMSIQQTHKTTYYSPANPKKLLTQIKQTEETFEKLLPNFLAIYNERPKKPSVQIFEGKEGVRQVYLEIANFLKKNKEVLFYGRLEHFKKYEDISTLWLKEIQNKKYKIRELLYKETKTEKDYIKKQQNNKNPNHQIRFLSQEENNIINDNCIFENKLVIFSIREDFFAIVIDSQDIANSYRAIFELIWKNK